MAGVFGEGGVAAVVQAVFYAPVVAVAGEQERGAGLGGGQGGDGQDGLAGDFRAAAGGAGGQAEVVAVSFGGGGAAGCGGGASVDGVAVALDEHELGGAGEPLADRVGDLAGDADGADLVPGRARFRR